MTKRLIFLVVTAVVAAAAAFAQMPKAVEWSMTFKKTSANEGVVMIHADVAEGWHLYGLNLPEGGPSATTIQLTASKGVKFIGQLTPSASPVKVNDPMFGMELNWWDSPVTFTCKVSLKGAPKDWVINAKISNMACNDQNCMPPTQTDLKVSAHTVSK